MLGEKWSIWKTEQICYNYFKNYNLRILFSSAMENIRIDKGEHVEKHPNTPFTFHSSSFQFKGFHVYEISA